jgi:hypothetical protein
MSKLQTRLTILIAALGLSLFTPQGALAEVSASCIAACESTYRTEVLRCTSTITAPDGTEQSETDPICEADKVVDKEACSRACGQSSTGTSGSTTPGTVTLLNPLGLSDPRLIVGRIIKGVLSIVGTVTLAMFMYGGILWITSMGESKKVEKGKSIFVWTTLGLGIIAIAYTAVNAIMNALRTGSVT